MVGVVKRREAFKHVQMIFEESIKMLVRDIEIRWLFTWSGPPVWDDQDK